MPNFPNNPKKYYRFPKATSLVDYTTDYLDYYPYPNSTIDEYDVDQDYQDDTYHMKGEIK